MLLLSIARDEEIGKTTAQQDSELPSFHENANWTPTCSNKKELLISRSHPHQETVVRLPSAGVKGFRCICGIKERAKYPNHGVNNWSHES